MMEIAEAPALAGDASKRFDDGPEFSSVRVFIGPRADDSVEGAVEADRRDIDVVDDDCLDDDPNPKKPPIAPPTPPPPPPPPSLLLLLPPPPPELFLELVLFALGDALREKLVDGFEEGVEAGNPCRGEGDVES